MLWSETPSSAQRDAALPEEEFHWFLYGTILRLKSVEVCVCVCLFWADIWGEWCHLTTTMRKCTKASWYFLVTACYFLCVCVCVGSGGVVVVVVQSFLSFGFFFFYPKTQSIQSGSVLFQCPLWHHDSWLRLRSVLFTSAVWKKQFNVSRLTIFYFPSSK